MSKINAAPINLAVFASGAGSNLQSLIDSILNGNLNARIRVVISNNSKSGALQRVKKHDIPGVHLSHRKFKTEEDKRKYLLDIEYRMKEAAENLEKSEIARNIFGDDVIDHYVGHARLESEAYEKSVSLWELKRYFESI